MKRVSALLAAVAVATLGTFAFATAAAATTEPIYADVPAIAQDWPSNTPQAAAESGIDCTTGGVTLTKTDGTVGTSAETTNLGLDADTAGTIKVDVTLDDDAQAAAGAVRMFAYGTPGSDTSAGGGQAPQFGPAIAGPGGGTLALAVNGGVGTFGLTYDASNASTGTVTFSGLEFWADGANEGRPIYLCAKPEPEETETTATTTTTAATSTTTAAALAVTGASLTGVLVAAAVVLGAGVVLLVVARRRRV